MRYVLVIPGWFPSKVNFLAGDFIERHARAAALYFPVKILFVVKDNSLPFGKIELDHQKHSENFETFIYYYSSRSVSLIEKFISVWLQVKCLSKGFKKIIAVYGLPSLIHAHVLIKYGWFALKKSKQYNIPLLASEQWTGYLPEARHEFKNLSFFYSRSLKAIFKHAVHVTTVSNHLAQEIKKRFDIKSYSVIPNLVDTSIFKPSKKTDNRKIRIIHISTLSPQKNFDEIIDACQLMSYPGNFELIVVGSPKPEYIQRVYRSSYEHYIIFKNEVSQTELNKLIADSDALLLYSIYETFGCVIVEANACGIPVIVSDYPVFNENVIEGVTGFKVPLHNTKALADCMMKIINNQHSFNKEEIISITKEKYAFEVIGKQFAAVYNLYAKP